MATMIRIGIVACLMIAAGGLQAGALCAQGH